MITLHIQDYKGYSICFTNKSGVTILVFTDYVISYLTMNTTSIVNRHPSVKSLNKFKRLIDFYLSDEKE